MLYGKRPFGEGCSQEKILRDEVMLNAKAVHFPAKPALSAEGKEFISRSATCSMIGQGKGAHQQCSNLQLDNLKHMCNA